MWYDQGAVQRAEEPQHASNMRQKLATSLRYVVAAGIIVGLVLLCGNSGRTWQTLRSVEAGWACYGVLAMCTAIFLGGLRWLLLLRALGYRLRLWQLVQLWLAGFFFDNFLPSTVGGDIARGYELTRRRVPLTAVAASLLVGRLFGLISLGVWSGLVLLVSLTIRGSTTLSVPNVLGACVAAGGTALLVWATHLGGSRRDAHYDTGAKVSWLTRIVAAVHDLAQTLRAYRGQTITLSAVFGLSMLMWTVDAWVLFSCIRGAGIGMAYRDVIGLNTTLNWAAAVPVSIGGIGVQECTLTMLLRELGVATSVGLAVGLTYRAVRWSVALLGGLSLALSAMQTAQHTVPSQETS
ncbi:MAG: lysylphosphatidylglycerol synthase transmembrane domain-containing protein [Armatimonadota bacterium]|nr:lysylphosphatidylglycerol synthase transmembrane domain-containing protein [Armatimonadota bacterium]